MKGDGFYKRPGSPFWYFKLKENGRWREISTKKTKYKDAKKVRHEKLREQEDGLLPEGERARRPFEELSEKYLEYVAVRLRPSSLKKERFFLVRPTNLFGQVRCESITASHIQQLQSQMKADGCSNSYVNLVIGATSRVLGYAKTWRRIRDDVRRLPERKAFVARVLTPEQKLHLFKIAASKSHWTVAYAAAVIAVNTTMRGADLRRLRWSTVDLIDRTAVVPDSKTEAGVRRIPLNDDAFFAFRLLRERAEKLGYAEPCHYVFFTCERGNTDPAKPQKTWRTSWRSLTAAAGLKGLRFHDLRHQCITELAELGAPEQSILAIAGHVSRRMLEHYSHIRLEAKREALQALSSVTGINNANQTTESPDSLNPSVIVGD
jgi:integrase